MSEQFLVLQSWSGLSIFEADRRLQAFGLAGRWRYLLSSHSDAPVQLQIKPLDVSIYSPMSYIFRAMFISCMARDEETDLSGWICDIHATEQRQKIIVMGHGKYDEF